MVATVSVLCAIPLGPVVNTVDVLDTLELQKLTTEVEV